MSNLFYKPRYTNVKHLKNDEQTNIIPKGTWLKCDNCGVQLLRKQVVVHLSTCHKCGHHFRMKAHDRVAHLMDKGSFEEWFADISSGDPLEFKDAKGRYPQKIQQQISEQHMNEGILVGSGKMQGHSVILGVMNFYFMGGSMGSAVGEKITLAMERSIKERMPLVLITSSGGARMQEGILSLMQMAKTCVGLEEMHQAKIPFISVLTDPTMGGVTASFASLGDVIIAEPGALIGFAGPRVIEQTIRQKLPKKFQTAEFLLEHGFVDMIVSRHRLKETLVNLIDFFEH